MKEWYTHLKYNPIPALLSSGNESIVFFTKRDLLDEKASVETLWNLKEAQRIVKRQQSNGSWKYPGGREKIRSQENYDQIETYRNLGYLVEMFGFNNKSEVIKNAAEFLFDFQTKDGDIRGIYGNQYTPNYTAGILELLIKAGYKNDQRVEKALQWLISIRQYDGGWVIPLRTCNKNLNVVFSKMDALEPNRYKPFSHLITGVVLRAFAAHSEYRKSPEAKRAANLLLSSLFKKDSYPDRGTAEYWLRFTFPFWFTDLISAMDSLSLIGLDKEEPQMQKAIDWFVKHQQKSGLWDLKYLKNLQYTPNLWFSLAICRIFKRLY